MCFVGGWILAFPERLALALVSRTVSCTHTGPRQPDRHQHDREKDKEGGGCLVGMEEATDTDARHKRMQRLSVFKHPDIILTTFI
jgi:hypothetical protein